MTRCFPCLFSIRLSSWYLKRWYHTGQEIIENLTPSIYFLMSLCLLDNIASNSIHVNNKDLESWCFFFSCLPPNQWLVTMSFQLSLFKQHWPCWVRGNYWFLLVDDFEIRCREIHRLRSLQKHMDLKRTTHRR